MKIFANVTDQLEKVFLLILFQRGGVKLKKLIIAILVLFALSLILPSFGVNTSFIISNLIEWSTKFILPWIILYWIIRLVRVLERSK